MVWTKARPTTSNMMLAAFSVPDPNPLIAEPVAVIVPFVIGTVYKVVLSAMYKTPDGANAKSPVGVPVAVPPELVAAFGGSLHVNVSPPVPPGKVSNMQTSWNVVSLILVIVI